MKKLFLLSFSFLLLLAGCGGREYSVILSPQNLKKHLSEDLMTYSKEMGRVRKVSENVFWVESDCWTRGYECPISDYVKKFYGFYCTQNGGTLNGMEFLKKKIALWNKKLDEETEKLNYPEYYKRICSDYKITPSDLFGHFIGERPDLACYIPSKEFFMVSYSYSCHRENAYWVKCPYKIEVADFSLEDLDKALEKAYEKELSTRKRCIESNISSDRIKDAVVSYFDLPPLCGFCYFSFSVYSPTARARFVFENPSNEPVGVAFNRVGIIGRVPGYEDKYVTLSTIKPDSDFIVLGDCEKGKNMTVWVKPGGKCTVLLRNLTGDISMLNSLVDKNMDIYLVFNGKTYPAKKVSLYEARVMEEKLKCQSR